MDILIWMNINICIKAAFQGSDMYLGMQKTKVLVIKNVLEGKAYPP